MWIYTFDGGLLNLDNCRCVGSTPEMCFASDDLGDRYMLSKNQGDIERIYSALNAGVRVLNLRGEQNG